jgi:zinc transport system ATP-binding protein
MKKTVVEIENLYFSYQNTPVLSDVSLNVREGEFVGLIGPNGGGKTTLLKLTMGFLRPLKGSLLVFNESPHMKPASLQRIGYVPQAVRFDKEFPISVLEVVLSGILSRLPWYGYFSKQDRQQALEILESMGLSHLTDRAFGMLSGGQAQRVLIARALISKPELLVLDEPTASVDSEAEANIYDILKKLKGEITILMVTHNLHAAISQVDRLYCVQGNAFPLQPAEVCEHFAIGLYHTPLAQSSNRPK